jgi:Flp pilus assembly protein TadG
MRTARGQASIEFALVIPLFLLLVVGIFDVARAYVAATVVAACAREAARSGALHYPQPGWDTQARQAGLNLAVGVDASALSVTVTQTTIDASLQPYVRAEVTYPFRSLTPLIGTLLGDPLPLTASTVVLAG